MLEGGSAYPSVTIRRKIDFPDVDLISGEYSHQFVLRLFIAAEAELLDTLGLLELFSSLPRTRVELEFHRMLRFKDLVDASVRVAEVGRTSLTFSCELRKEGWLAAEGRVVAVQTGLEGEPKPWSEVQRNLLEGRADPS